VATVEPARPPAGSLGQRLEFGTSVSDLSSRLIHLPSNAVEREIDDGLRRACELLGIDLAVLGQWSSVAPAVNTREGALVDDGVTPLGSGARRHRRWLGSASRPRASLA